MGVVYCWVWRVGCWVDIFVDDFVFLVVNSGGICFFFYCYDKDEFWLMFIEKVWVRYGWWD